MVYVRKRETDVLGRGTRTLTGSPLAPTSAYGSGRGRSRLAQRQGVGAITPPRKRLVGGQANESSSCSGSHLLEALSPPGTPGASSGTRVNGRGDGLTYNRNWGSEIEPTPLCFPPLLLGTPRHGSSARKEGTKEWPGREKISETGGFLVRSLKDGLPRDQWRLQCCHKSWLKSSSPGPSTQLSTTAP